MVSSFLSIDLSIYLSVGVCSGAGVSWINISVSVRCWVMCYPLCYLVVGCLEGVGGRLGGVVGRLRGSSVVRTTG